MQTIAHFILGAALAYANGADPLAGDSAAVAAERAAGYLAKQYDDGHTAIDPISGQFNPNLLPEHIKEEIKAQTGAIASVVGAAGGSLKGTNGGNGALFDAQVAGTVGQNAVENNYLTSTTLDDVKKGKKSKEDALRIYRINKENLERQCATSQSSPLCRAAVNTAKDFVNNQLAKHFFPDEVKTTNQLLEKYSEAAQYKPAPLKINLPMEKSMFTGEGLPEGRTSDYIKGTGKSILAYVWDERGGATGGAQYGMPIGTFAYNQYALENPYQTTKTRQEYLGSVYGPAVLTLTGAKFRIRPTRPITTKPIQGKIIPIGESYIPSSPRAVKGTTVTLAQEQRLANGELIPKGSVVTWSDNAVQVVRPNGSKRVFNSRDWEQKALPKPQLPKDYGYDPNIGKNNPITDGGKISAKRARWTYSEETNPPITNEYLVRKYGAENVQQGGGRFLETRERVLQNIYRSQQVRAQQKVTPVTVWSTSGGTANAATYPKLINQLKEQNLKNIAAQDSRLASAVNDWKAMQPNRKGEINFGIGSATAKEADKLGKIWVGDGARPVNSSSCPGCLLSADGTRLYRPPTIKSNTSKAFNPTGVQANFVIRNTDGKTLTNGHLNIK